MICVLVQTSVLRHIVCPLLAIHINICENTHILILLDVCTKVQRKRGKEREGDRERIKKHKIKKRYCFTWTLWTGVFIDQINRKIFSFFVVITLFGCLEQRMKIMFFFLSFSPLLFLLLWTNPCSCFGKFDVSFKQNRMANLNHD